MLMAKLRLSGDFDYPFLAKSTPGYVGADLSALTGAAGVIAVKRIFDVGVDSSMAVDDDTPLTSGQSTPLPTPLLPDSSDLDTSTALAMFSTLPTSLAALPIASFLQSHPRPLSPSQLSSLSSPSAHPQSKVQPHENVLAIAAFLDY